MAKVMITMPEEMLKQVDKKAAVEHWTRSELIRAAVRAYLAEVATGKPPALMSRPEVRRAVELQDQAREKWRDAKFDSVAFIRKMRGPLK